MVSSPFRFSPPWPPRSLAILSFLAAAFSLSAEENDQRPAKGIQDNSFFIEEAYNQEAGVVQHILNITGLVSRRAGPDDKEWSPVFTQEWPIGSQTHQLSYTVPYLFTETAGQSGDVLINYRFQAFTETSRRPAFAPRFSLILPTGDEARNLGNGVLGYQFNLPVSKIVSDRWTRHFNAGGSAFPDVKGHDLWNYNLGASAIYAVSKDLNLMLESVAGWNEDVDLARHVAHTTSALISPGARYAFNLPNDLQIVIGAAVPIGLTSDSPDWGLFFYLSFEHPFIRSAIEKAK